jgi:hypothetical protein
LAGSGSSCAGTGWLLLGTGSRAIVVGPSEAEKYILFHHGRVSHGSRGEGRHRRDGRVRGWQGAREIAKKIVVATSKRGGRPIDRVPVS